MVDSHYLLLLFLAYDSILTNMAVEAYNITFELKGKSWQKKVIISVFFVYTCWKESLLYITVNNIMIALALTEDLISLALLAYLSVLWVSSYDLDEGPTFAIITVLQLPPRESLSILVSLLSLYGIWAFLLWNKWGKFKITSRHQIYGWGSWKCVAKSNPNRLKNYWSPF